MMQKIVATKFPTMLKINKRNGWIKIRKILSGAILLIVLIAVVGFLLLWIQ